MESKNEETGDSEYQRAFAALDELNLVSLKPFFKENDLQDDTFSFMKSEEELRNLLTQELKLSFGKAFKFSRLWFNKYHESTETLDGGIQSPQREEKPGHLHSEKVTTTTEVQWETLPFTTPCRLNEYSAKIQPPNSTQITDGFWDSATFKEEDKTIKLTKEQEDSKRHPTEYVCVSAPILSLSESQLKEGIPEEKGSCQPELQASSQVKAVSDRENRNNERLNACLVKESSHTRADVQEAATDIQYTIYLTTDDISLKKDMKSPINVGGNLEDAHKELPGPSITAETTVVTTANEGHCAVSAVQVNTTQSGTSDEGDQASSSTTSGWGEEGPCENVTPFVTDKKFVGDGQDEHETHRIEQSDDDAYVDAKTNQEDVTDNKAQDFKGDSIGKYQEESAGNKPPTSDANKQEDVPDRCEDETRRKTTDGNNSDTRTETRNASGLPSTDCDPCSKEDAEKLENKDGKTTRDVLIENLVSDINNNTMKIDVRKMAAFASTESLAAREERSGVEKAQNGTEERKKRKEGYGTSLNEQIPVETFSQRSGPDMKSYLPETGQKDISKVVSKCYCGNQGTCTNHTTTNECQEQSTKAIIAKKEVVDVEDEGHDTSGTEQSLLYGEKEMFPNSFPASRGRDKSESHHSNAKENKNRNKSKVEITERSQNTTEKYGKKDHTSSKDKSLSSTNSDPCSKEDVKRIENKLDKITNDGKGNTNNNTMKIDVCEMAFFASTEALAAKEERSGVEKAQNGSEESSEKGKEGYGTSLNEQILVETSNQRSGPDMKSYLPETGQKDISKVVSKCTPRALGAKGKEIAYKKGLVLDAEENKEVEFKSLTSAHPSTLPWKIMDKAKKFICACLNADSKGIIYFGVGDSQEQCSKFKRGEILGLDVEDVIDDIMKAFQFVLDDHIKSDDGPLQKGGDQNCVNLEFVPVECEGSRTNLYVIEIEVIRDWKFCKDNVYYCKCWSEKRDRNRNETDRDPSTKKALSDFYKVHKDQFEDVAIRTNGASTSLKQHEVNRQVREPLMAKYKEWKTETRSGADESPEDLIPDSDVKRFSTLVRERLRDLNFKDYGYVLITNKLPPRYRGTPNLAFLQNIPWLAVFDLFDSASKKDGLYYVCNETTDAPRAKLRSLDDFKEVSSDWISGKDFDLSTRGTTWILGNEEMQKGGWIKCSRDCFYRALSTYKLCCPLGRLLCVFLGLDESSVQEMVDMMECCFSILGNAASNCVTIISESKHVSDAFVKASRELQRELRECSITGMSWTLLKEIVREMVGPTKFEDRGAKTELPYFTGFKEVFNKMIHSWDDLEVYSPNPRLPCLVDDIEKARNAFYKGAQASQTNLFHNHCIPRTLEEETILKIEQALKALSKPSKDISCHVKTITVTYEPGSGATTLCRRILWNKRKAYRCAVVKAITSNTDYQIEQLQGIIYDEKNFKFAPPCLVLVDNFPQNETRRLTERIMKRQTKCVILSTFPIAKLNANADFDLTLRQLDEKEMSLVKDILINITSDSKRRREAEEVLEREKRFIWFGLELFGRHYDKIKERLQNHIKSTLDFLDDSQEIHERVLNFCCFLHYYSDGRAILPHPVVSDFLYEASNENEEDCALMPHIHKIFGGLLLEGFNETNGYYGWRPAHSLVSEAVTSRINIEDTAVVLLEEIHKGKAYVNKFLKEQVFKVFLDRKRISDAVFLEDKETDDGSIDSDFMNEVLGFYEVKTRYSPLIVDILEGDDGIQKALRLLITICQKASEMEEKAYAWQQLARFMGYEMRANEMSAKSEQHHRLHTTMSKQRKNKEPMPKTGIEAAHIAVDIAINQQPKYSHHYVTKGTLYLLQLRDFKPEERPTLPASMPEVIDICRKALDVYDKALSTTHQLNYYSMIGKIQAIVSLLEIVKGLPFFRLDGESITRYLKKAEIPREMEDVLTQEEHNYIKSLSTTTFGLLNEVFGDVKFRHMTTYDDNAIRGLINAKIRASKLRRIFYEVTGFDKSELSDPVVPMPSQPLTRDAQALNQQFVQDVLFKKNETPYSTWVNLTDEEVSLIYILLKVLCSRGYGSHEDMLICCKACLRLKERTSVEELDEIVSKWVSKYPNSEWAHLFNYMIHFPIPDKRLAAFNHSAKESIKKCNKIVLDKIGKGFRKSGAEYFLGKGTGLYAIANSQQFRSLETKGETKTDFWRSKEISDKLERVCGQKDVNFNGVIAYQGIQLRFDDTRYPKQSKDDLWFYVGFSVSGPYAYDPVDNDTYAILSRNTNGSSSLDFPLFENVNGQDNFGAPVARRERLCELKSTVTKRGQKSEGANASEFSDVSYSTLSKEKQAITLSVPECLNTLTNSPSADDPRMAENSAVSSGCFNAPAMGAMSSWASVDSLHRPAASANRVSYASAVQLGNIRREEQMPKTTSKQQSGPLNSLCAKSRKWKSIEGTRGMEKHKFQPKYVDKTGKLHHGAWVLGAKKSKECDTHRSEGWDNSITSHCPFAHSWRADTLQYVCKECTRKNKEICREKRNHEAFIFNLGPYLNEEGKIWKETRQERPK